MSTRTGRFATIAAAFLWTVPVLAAPPQSRYAVSHPSRPTPPKAVVDQGLSLEHECLNVLRATRTAARRQQPEPGDGAKRDTAALHLDRAESAARAGHGQLCEDEVALAAESLR